MVEINIFYALQFNKILEIKTIVVYNNILLLIKKIYILFKQQQGTIYVLKEI